MLIILPPSETKRPAPDAGDPLDLRRLSFAQINPLRAHVLEALIETSSAPDAFERLRVRPSLVEQVLANTDLREAPTRPAAEVYAGPLHAGFGWATLSASARLRAEVEVVVASALWGLVRPTDPIPSYRLHVCSSLVGLDDLEPYWRTALPAVLSAAAGVSAVVLDLRSPVYQAMGRAPGGANRLVTVRVLPEAGARTIGDVVAKRIRGEIAAHLLESAADPVTPDDLVDALSDRWSGRLDPPHSRRAGRGY